MCLEKTNTHKKTHCYGRMRDTIKQIVMEGCVLLE